MSKSPAYKADKAAAVKAAYKYSNNPFEEGSRRYRMFEKAQAHKHNMDMLFEDYETVYGFIGVKREIINNKPGTFKRK